MTQFISLFSGCGGFDYGFISQEYKCLGAYDIEPSAVSVYKKNVCSKAYLHDLTSCELPNQQEAEQAELIIAGSPCQGFSTVGKRNFDDPRNQLLIRSAEITLQIKPKVLVCENVPSVKSGKHKYYWDKLVEMLTANGYHTEEFLYNFSHFGLPQMRKRLFLIAYKGKKVNRDDLLLKEEPSVPLKKVLLGASKQKNHSYIKLDSNNNDSLIASKINIGQKLSNVRGGDKSIHTWDIPEVFGSTTERQKELLLTIMKLRRQIRKRDYGDADPVSTLDISENYTKPFKSDLSTLIKKGFIVEKSKGEFDLTNTFNGKYRRLNPNTPSLTVDTNFWNPRYFLHPTRNRGFSAREAARIQGFPDDFSFEGTFKQQFTMIGNAVPPAISEKLASIIKVQFFS